MASKKYGFTPKLIDKITHKDCPNNNTFTYYHHRVELLRGTVDYVNATVYKTEDSYGAILVSFSFDYWTMKLVIKSAVDKDIAQCVIDAFDSLYHYEVSVVNQVEDVDASEDADIDGDG